MHFHLPARRNSGFTLIEIMVVVAIIAIVMAAGIPSMTRALRRDDLARAVNDTIEGCKSARDRAILQSVPHEFILRENGVMDVRPLPLEQQISSGPSGLSSGGSSGSAARASPYADFPRNLGEDVMIQLIGVNFVNLMEAPEARVRFYPNGTCDEFTVVYAWKGKQRSVTLDIITGLASELIRD